VTVELIRSIKNVEEVRLEQTFECAISGSVKATLVIN